MSDGTKSGGGKSRPRPEEALVRHEEELSVDKTWRGVGSVRARPEHIAFETDDAPEGSLEDAGDR